MSSPIDPIRRAAQLRRAKRTDSDKAEEAAAADGANLPVPVDTASRPVPPEPAVDNHAVFAAQLIGQDGQKRGLRAGAPHIDSANASYNRAEWSGSKDRRAPRGRHAKTEI